MSTKNKRSTTSLSRRVQPKPSWYQQHGISTDPPPQDSLFWTLWNNNLSIAKKALQTGFIQGIKEGNLDVNDYGSYVVMDAYYCFEAADDYLTAAGRASGFPPLQAFLEHKHQSYQNYNEQFSQQWKIGGTSCLLPDQAVLNYSKLEKRCCTEENPIYALIVMLPCEYLWAWLAEQISEFATDSNLYSFWITGNSDPSGAFAMGNVIDAFQKAHPGVIDPLTAQEFYGGAMTGELNDFAAATASSSS